MSRKDDIYAARFEIGLLRLDDEHYEVGPWWVGPIGKDPLNSVKYADSLHEVMRLIEMETSHGPQG